MRLKDGFSHSVTITGRGHLDSVDQPGAVVADDDSPTVFEIVRTGHGSSAGSSKAPSTFVGSSSLDHGTAAGRWQGDGKEAFRKEGLRLHGEQQQPHALHLHLHHFAADAYAEHRISIPAPSAPPLSVSYFSASLFAMKL